jgi:poly-gamma-glutamate capsule biosynthesis protein CapA/YwtB (metallophosphatase superfamily)
MNDQPRTALICCPRPVACWITWAATVFLILALSGCEVRVSESTSAPVVTLALLGDVMLGRSVRPTPETFSYLKPFLTLADLALANLESPLTDSPVQTESPYALCAPPENVEYLVDAGFDLLSLSNNHNFDCGAKGLLETQSTLMNAGLGFIGPEPVYHLVNGIQLIFLAFDATAQLDIEAAVQSVRSARGTGAVVIVSMHWGAEYQSGASTSQKEIVEQLGEAGAALIWGHHPHVLQPVEWIDDSQTLVLYSLGNGLFDQYGLENTRRSALVLVMLDSYGVKQFSAIPFLIDVPNSRIVGAGQTDVEVIMEYFK